MSAVPKFVRVSREELRAAMLKRAELAQSDGARPVAVVCPVCGSIVPVRKRGRPRVFCPSPKRCLNRDDERRQREAADASPLRTAWARKIERLRAP